MIVLASRDAYFDAWRDLHGGYDPRDGTLVRWWLSLTYVLARPVARAGVPPDAVTLLAVAVSALAAGIAGLGGRWLVLAGVVVVVSGLLDNLDGAVALLRGRTSRWGFVLDSLADRVSDTAYVVLLWLAGAPGWLAASGGALMFLHEYARARAVAGGMAEVGVVTVWERPTRVIVTAAFAVAAGLLLDDLWAVLGAAAWVGLGAVGLAQLLVVVRHRLR